MHSDEKTKDEHLETLINYQPCGAETVMGYNRRKDLFTTEPEKLEAATQAVEELKMVKELADYYTMDHDPRIPQKIGQFISIWNEKFLPDEKHETSPIDQRLFYGFFDGTLTVWEELTPDAQKAVTELATKAVTNELAYQLIHGKREGYKQNFASYSNLNILTAAAVMQKLDPEGAQECVDIFINGNTYKDVDRLGFAEQVKWNVLLDGSVIDYTWRDSIHYQIFNQIAWERTLKVCEYLGISVPIETAEKITKARQFTEDCIEGKVQHLEFLNSHNPKDKERFADRYGKPFDPQNDKYTIEEYKNAIAEPFAET